MRRIAILAVIAASTSSIPLVTAQVTVVSAASYTPALAPESLASIFGRELATSTVVARLNELGVLPEQLAETVVEFGGIKAGLIVVSPNQINCVVPKNVALGTVQVTVRNGTRTLTGMAQVNVLAPALFSIDASGKGPGAILNAVTYRVGSFTISTRENPSSDKRTRLALYATGIRSAQQSSSSVYAEALDQWGRTLRLPIEYAGPAPGRQGPRYSDSGSTS